MLNIIEDVVTHLNGLVKDQEFEVLFAIESGSRLWGIPSKDSDYDVRFVYHYPKKRYLSLFNNYHKTYQSTDVKLTNQMSKKISLDMVGWDITKFLKLLVNSNPSAIEWIQSEIIYIDHPILIKLRSMIKNFNRFSLFMHYRSLANSNYQRYIKDNPEPSAKKILYVLRGILNSYFIYIYNTLPPLELRKTLERLYTIEKSGESKYRFPADINPITIQLYNHIVSIIDEKMKGYEINNISISEELLEFVELSFVKFDDIKDNLRKFENAIAEQDIEQIYFNIVIND